MARPRWIPFKGSPAPSEQRAIGAPTAPICLHEDAPAAPIDAAVVTSNSTATPNCNQTAGVVATRTNLSTYMHTLCTKRYFQDSQARLQPHM